jgi:hypothetical protein
VIIAGPKANISLLDQTVQQKLANAIPGKRKIDQEKPKKMILIIYKQKKLKRKRD